MAEHEISMAERKDLLVLAQQKLDDMNRGNSFLAKSKSSKTVSSLLSTLLYLSLISYKVEDMKAILKHLDFDTYEQWEGLLTVLHSPEFHIKERSLQNERVTRIFERKQLYKTKASDLEEQLSKVSNEFKKVQRIANDTSNEMSKTINMFRQEVSEVNTKLNEAHSQLELDRIEIACLKDNVAKKDLIIEDLKQQLETASENAVHVATELNESKSRTENVESHFVTYKEEKESQANELQHELDKAKSMNASLSEQLASLRGNLEANVALLLKSTDVLVEKSEKQTTDNKETLIEMHNVLLQVKDKRHIDVEELLQSIRATLCEEMQTVRNLLEGLTSKPCIRKEEILEPMKLSMCEALQAVQLSLETLIATKCLKDDPASAFVENVLSEALMKT